MKTTILNNCLGFEWDEHNESKNQQKHNVAKWECEQLFFNEPLLLNKDVKHSQAESRYYALGKTDSGRRLFIVFTIRGHLIRIISARDMSRKERAYYEQVEKNSRI